MPDETKTEETLPDPTEFEDTLSEYIKRIEEAEERAEEDADLKGGIITSRDLKIPALTRGPVKRRQIAWRLYQHPMFYIVKVDPDTRVEKHSHDEDIFRLMIEGSLTVNGMELKEGEWFVVTAGTPYEIETKCGYTVMAAYRMACKPKPN